MKVFLEDDQLRFEDYPYAPSSVYPTGKVTAADLVEIVPQWLPAAARLRSGEYLLLPSFDEETLVAFGDRHGVPVVPRADVWGQILEPFLFGAGAQTAERSLAKLESWGVARIRVDALRRLVGDAVAAHGDSCMEDVHLGIMDVLDAMGPVLTEEGFTELYDEVMDLAARGPVLV
jgi:hypothetical protein